MIISIAGPCGSGKGTVARILAERLKYKAYSTGNFRRTRAKTLGITIEAYNKLGEKDNDTDTEADLWQKELGTKEDDFVIDARLAWFFIPHSVKVYLDVDPLEGAKRIFHDSDLHRINQLKGNDLKAQAELNAIRNSSDEARYYLRYGINDLNSPQHFDLVVDSTHITPEQAADKIIDFCRFKGLMTAPSARD